MSYSVVGDAVNIASRLCSAARPGEIVISEFTQHIVGEKFHIKERQPVHAKGKRNPIKAYAVLGHRPRQGTSIYKGIEPIKPAAGSRTG
jgi:adenylate cyclase